MTLDPMWEPLSIREARRQIREWEADEAHLSAQPSRPASQGALGTRWVHVLWDDGTIESKEIEKRCAYCGATELHPVTCCPKVASITYFEGGEIRSVVKVT